MSTWEEEERQKNNISYDSRDLGMFELGSRFEEVNLNWFEMKVCEKLIVWIKEKMIKFEWKICEWRDRCDKYFNINNYKFINLSL